MLPRHSLVVTRQGASAKMQAYGLIHFHPIKPVKMLSQHYVNMVTSSMIALLKQRG